ncbi:hypothetical protein HPHPH16_1416 [Helicobacter pylori Hp H-16]|nr:hypothetical protein HPHPH16_1416 [Helicobacter pylori Hp H-16]WQY00844.1 hypothetical protein KVK82_06035 [Helicobacter pylori]
MAHFIFSVAVVLLWLVAWGIYLVFVKNLKREMEEIENSDPNQNNPFITAAMGISQIPNQSLMASSRWLRKVCKRRLEKTSSQRGKKFNLFLKIHFVMFHCCCSHDRFVSHLEFQWVVFLESNGLFSSLYVCLFRFNITKYIYC